MLESQNDSPRDARTKLRELMALKALPADAPSRRRRDFSGDVEIEAQDDDGLGRRIKFPTHHDDVEPATVPEIELDFPQDDAAADGPRMPSKKPVEAPYSGLLQDAVSAALGDRVWLRSLLSGIGEDTVRGWLDDRSRVYSRFPFEFNLCEAAVFDNWGSEIKPKGKKKADLKEGEKRSYIQAHRFAMSLKIWERDGVIDFKRNADLRAFANLIEAADMETEIARLSDPKKCKTPPSEEYKALIRDAVAQHPDCLIGMVYYKPPEGGTHYFDRVLVIVDRDQLHNTKLAIALLVMAEGTICLPRFLKTDAKMQPLRGNCMMQSRSARDGAMSYWRTGPFDRRPN